MHDVAEVVRNRDERNVFFAAPSRDAEDEVTIFGWDEGKATEYGSEILNEEVFEVPARAGGDYGLESPGGPSILPDGILVCRILAEAVLEVSEKHTVESGDWDFAARDLLRTVETTVNQHLNTSFYSRINDDLSEVHLSALLLRILEDGVIRISVDEDTPAALEGRDE